MSVLTLICHQLRSPENLGAIARVMTNFGHARLVLSDPLTHDFRGAEKTAVGAERVLQNVAVAANLREALKGVTYAIGTTSRTSLKRHQPLSVETAMARLTERAVEGPVALVLGGEKRGLSDEELSWVQDVTVIPTSDDQPSMNVAQAAAVLLFAYTRAKRPATPPPRRQDESARLEMVHALEDVMTDVLLRAEFLNPQAPQHTVKDLSRILTRANLSQREAGQWLSAFEHVQRLLKR